MSGAPEDPARELLQNEIGPRELRGGLLFIASALAVAMSLFHLYAGGFGALVDMRQRSLHLAFALVLAFLHFPLLRRWRDSFPVLLLDLALALAAGAAALYPFFLYDQVLQRVGAPNTLDLAVAVTLTILVLEATRRSISVMLPVVALVFLVYALIPQAWLPELIAHRDYSLRRVMDQMFMATEGIFGIPLGVSATYVFLFVFFGSALEALGAGQYLIDLSVSLMGRFRGGPAKAAVLASGAMGTISGSSIANTVTTGVITIPLMRKVGFPAVNAGAVEVAASTNGQLVPPVMGAAAFIMAETLGVSYAEVVRAAILPALLSYTAIFAIVHLDAVKLGLGALDRRDIPPFFFTFFRGAHFMIPLVQLFVLLILGRTPMYAAFYSIVSALFLLLIETPVRRLYNLLFSHPLLTYSPEQIEPFRRVAFRFGRVFVLGARNMIGIAVACACCGMIIGVVSLTGLAGQISHIIVTLAGGKLLPTLVISVFVAIILGMGLPTTATYIMMAAMVAPAILAGAAEAGVQLPLIAVHMFVFYYGIVADDTPPVGLCAYAASGISGADPIRTGLKSFSLDLAAFTLPFMFIYNPELLLIDVHLAHLPHMILFAVIGMVAFSVAIQGYFAGPIPWWGRLVALLAAFLLVKPQIVPSLAGVAVLAGLYVFSRRQPRHRAVPPAPGPSAH